MKKCLLALVIGFISLHSYSQVNNVGIGTNDPRSKLDVQGGLALREGAPISLVAGNNDNIALPGGYSFYRIIAPVGAPFSILGVIPATGADGQVVTLVNTTAQVMTIKNNASGTATQSIRTLTGNDIVSVAGGSSVTLQYNKAELRWYVTGSQNFTVTSGSIATSDIEPGTNSAVTVVNGTGKAVGTGDVVLDVTTNALNQKGIVSAPTGGDDNRVWGTDAGGNPGWTKVGNTKLTNSSVTVNTGTGLSGGGTVALGGTLNIANTAPDQTVTLTNGSGISATGTYPSFTITNTGDVNAADDVTTASTAGGDLSGTFSNLQINSGAVGTTEIANGTIAAGDLSNLGAGSGQSIYWNGSAWVPYTPSAGSVTSVTASNGLNSTGGATPDIKLGGTLATSTDVALGSNNLTFSGAGNVGIGTAAPGAYRLNVQAGSGRALFQSTSDAPVRIQGTDNWSGTEFADVNGADVIWYHGQNSTFTIGGTGANLAGKKLHVDGGTSIGANYEAVTPPANGVAVEGTVRIQGGTPDVGKVLTATDNSGNAVWKDAAETGIKYPGTIATGNWYRIATNAGNRANAIFTLRDYISGGGHSTLSFRMGSSYNFTSGISFTLLNHNYYGTPTFTKVRVLTATTYDVQYLEVYAVRDGAVDYTITDNQQSSGWVPATWTAGSIPGGYTSNEYEVDKLFNVGNNDDKFTVDRNGNVGIGVTSPAEALHINGSVRGNQAGALRISSGSGTMDIGAQNASFAHIQTDRPLIYTNVGLQVDQGLIGSYNEDLSLQTQGTTRITASNTTGNVGVNNTNPGQKLDVTGNIRSSGHLIQGPIVNRPLATWGVSGNSTGAVLIYLPGTPFTNHGMLHMQIDVYEYGSTGVTTYIIGGHNWQNAWYNYTCNTIGTSPKKIRLAVKNNQYCVVLGEQGSTWSYGSVALTKITNGDYYKTNMDLTGAYSVVQDNTAETGYTWISADLNKGFLSSTGTTNYLARWTSPTTLGTGVSYDNGTNVGIGTTAPTQKLHVAGGLIATSLAVGETPYLITGYASGTSLWTIAGNNTQAKMLLATSHDWDRQIGLTYTPGTTGSAAGHLQIGQTDKNSTNWTHGVTSLYTNGAERIRIDNAGNVGVGTSSISVKLHVNGNAFFDLPAGGGALENSHTIKKAGQGQLNFGSYPGAWTPAIQIQNNDNTRFVWLSPMDNGSGANARLRVSGTGLDIYTGGAVDGGNYSTTFAANGNVGLGTTSPAVKLDVNGQIKISGGSPAAGKFLMSDGAGLGTWEYVSSPWESMGSDIRQACAGGGNDLVYEWGASYNNSGSVLRVTCNRWNTGFRVCTYPPYPTGDVEPFSWGGACWIWDTGSSWDDGCGSAYHSYYMQDAAGRYNMTGGNGCGSMPSVFRRKL